MTVNWPLLAGLILAGWLIGSLYAAQRIKRQYPIRGLIELGAIGLVAVFWPLTILAMLLMVVFAGIGWLFTLLEPKQEPR